MNEKLPIYGVHESFMRIEPGERVVISAPTGSGKSTMIPQWAEQWGKVLVVEPRRVACRGLADRVASLKASELGNEVGYIVKNENRSTSQSQILFVTTGVALKLLKQSQYEAYATIILDEFHERSLDLDLILALLLKRYRGRLVVMSATIAGDRIAKHISGQHLKGEGRSFPVQIQHVPGKVVLPESQGLAQRLKRAVDALPETRGDVLVFMPGKAEIEHAASQIRQWVKAEVLCLHGGLSLKEQAKIFESSSQRRFIVSTNVAETSITIPNVTVVIDSGLVRRTQYHRGRGYLTLSRIARDSADQRSGRAGRIQAGVCFRLWAEHGGLEPHTPPEIYREGLAPLVLAAAACEAEVDELPFLDPPKPYAIEAAISGLQMLGAIDTEQRITPRGQSLFQLPIDARLGRLLQEAEQQNTLPYILPLVAALSISRPLFRGGHRPDSDDDLKADGCDAIALINAVRHGRAKQHHLDPNSLNEARKTLKRLEQDWPSAVSVAGTVDKAALARTLLLAWPDAAHVARRRKRHVAWSNGGTEVELDERSAVDPRDVDYLIALDSRAMGLNRLKRKVILTLAMAATKAWFIDADIGQWELTGAVIEDGILLAKRQRKFAKQTLETQAHPPVGQEAREAISHLFLAGRLFKRSLQRTQERLEARGLWEQLNQQPGSTPNVSDWLRTRLEDLGVESGEDLQLLGPEDFEADDLPTYEREQLERKFPREMKIGPARFRFSYDVQRKEVTLHKVDGPKSATPSLQFLPRLPGWRVYYQDKNTRKTLRDRP